MKKVCAILFVLVVLGFVSTAFADGGAPAPAAGQPAVTQAQTVQTGEPGTAVGVQVRFAPRIEPKVTVVQPGEVKTKVDGPVTVQTADGVPLEVEGAVDVYAPRGIPIMIKEVPENPSWCARNPFWCVLAGAVVIGAGVGVADACGAFDREVSFK